MILPLTLAEDDFEVFYLFIMGLLRRSNTVRPPVAGPIKAVADQLTPLAKKHFGFSYERTMRELDEDAKTFERDEIDNKRN